MNDEFAAASSIKVNTLEIVSRDPVDQHPGADAAMSPLFSGPEV
jgi:hypothetical protein